MARSSLLTTDLEIIEGIETTQTYKLYPDKIQGFTDGAEALQQAIYKMLSTEKYEYPIYSFAYGIELDDLIGQDRIYVQAELERRIRECLLQDDRIQSVENFTFAGSGDTLTCEFDVASIYGNLSITKEVNI